MIPSEVYIYVSPKSQTSLKISTQNRPMMQMISMNVHCLSCILQADPKGPSFQTVFCNTEQMLKVEKVLIVIGWQFLSSCSKFFKAHEEISSLPLFGHKSPKVLHLFNLSTMFHHYKHEMSVLISGGVFFFKFSPPHWSTPVNNQVSEQHSALRTCYCPQSRHQKTGRQDRSWSFR